MVIFGLALYLMSCGFVPRGVWSLSLGGMVVKVLKCPWLRRLGWRGRGVLGVILVDRISSIQLSKGGVLV